MNEDQTTGAQPDGQQGDAKENTTSDMLGDTQGQDPRLTDRKADGAAPEDWDHQQDQRNGEQNDHSL